MSFPLIDVSEIGNSSKQAHIAEQVTAACKEWGFLLIRGHSIPQGDIDEMFTLGKTFFDLPEDDKAPYSINAQNIGYMGSFRDRWKDDKMSMWFGGSKGVLREQQQALPPFWRARVQTVEDFKQKCHDLIMQLLKCFALGLHLPDPEYFANAHKESRENGNALRMLMYPARDDSFVYAADRGGRMAEHTDSGSVTLLFQKSAGLEVLSPRGDGWVKAPCYPDCILVNIGDALSFWSGEQLKATLHRVTFDTVPSNQERQSMAYFAGAHPTTVLEPILPRQGTERYYSNGVELTPGMTVGQLRKFIINRIYHLPTSQKPAATST